MFNHDTPWKNIYIFYFIQKCYDNQELDIFKIKFCKKSPVFFPFGLEELITIYLYFAYLIINSKVHSVFSWPSSYSQQNIYLTSRVKIWQNQTIQETWQTLQKIPATFLSLFLRKCALFLITLASYGSYYFYLWFSPFLCFIHSPVDRLGRTKISSWKFPHIFLFFFVFWVFLQKPIGSHWFKKVLLELFSLSFFIKWWNSTKPFFFCMSRQYFCFFSHKNTIEIYLIYWNVLLWILSDCLAFYRNPTKFYIYLFFKKNIYI